MSADFGGRGGDMLTRTTLEFDARLSLPVIAALVAALQHVPGVLLADVSDGSGRAVIAHDSAVPGTSLLAAADRAGIRAQIVADSQAPDRRVLRSPGLRVRDFLTIAAGLLLVLAVADIFVPRLTGNGYVLAILLSFVWAFVIARAVFAGRK